MAEVILADLIRNPESRLGRAVLLFEERGHEVEAIGGGVYLVPSSNGTAYYRVDYRNETCNCPDADFHPEVNCKHVLMLGIALAKRRVCKALPCAACGGRFPRGELVEVHPEHESFSAYFEGERLCRASCAKHAGVL